MSITAPTRVKLISDAVVLLGDEPVSDIDNDDRISVRVGTNLFDRLYEDELQSCRWRFASTKKALSKLVDAPLNEWQSAFQLPSDMLLPIGVYPRLTPYEIYGDRIYTNASTLELDYLFKPDLTKLPAYFARMLVYALARDMARPLTESDTTVEDFQLRYERQRIRAMHADAQGRPNQPFSDSPFTDVR